jgi:hypothetical protein
MKFEIVVTAKNERQQIIDEIIDLVNQNIKTTQDATFLGWKADELVSQGERRKRIVTLRKKLARSKT